MKQQTGQDLKNQIKSKTTGYPLLGFCVYWSMSEFRMPEAQYKSLLQQADIDPKLYAKSVNPKSILTSVLKTQTKRLKNKFHRKSADNKDLAGFVIVNQESDDDANAQFQQETKIVFDKETKHIRVEGSQEEEIKNKFNSFLGTFSTDQFRNLVLKYLETECSAIAIRDRGGVYFVPIANEEAFRKLEQLFKLMPNCDIEVLPIVDTDEAKKSMWKALVSDLTGEINKLSEELSEMTAPSQKVFVRRIKKFKELKQKTAMYGDLLSGTVQDLMGRIDVLDRKLREKVDQEVQSTVSDDDDDSDDAEDHGEEAQ